MDRLQHSVDVDGVRFLSALLLFLGARGFVVGLGEIKFLLMHGRAIWSKCGLFV